MEDSFRPTRTADWAVTVLTGWAVPMPRQVKIQQAVTMLRQAELYQALTMLRQVGLYQAVTMLRQVGLCLCPDRLSCTRL